MLKKSLMILFFALIFFDILNGQEDSVEVFIIDGFVTHETPHTLVLSFFTSEEVKSQIKIDDNYIINVSEVFSEDHNAEIDFSNYKFNKKFVPYKIITKSRDGKNSESELFEIILPYEEFIETKEGSNPISTILFGLFLYFMPAPNLAIIENEKYFSITKELPIVTFYSSGFGDPVGNISLEYSRIYNSPLKNILRLGYKHFIPIDVFEYISPGFTGFTGFTGFNGISGEVSLGLFKIYDVFTVYTRYRYNMKPLNTNQDFHEISLGLHSLFFTIDY